MEARVRVIKKLARQLTRGVKGLGTYERSLPCPLYRNLTFKFNKTCDGKVMLTALALRKKFQGTVDEKLRYNIPTGTKDIVVSKEYIFFPLKLKVNYAEQYKKSMGKVLKKQEKPLARLAQINAGGQLTALGKYAAIWDLVNVCYSFKEASHIGWLVTAQPVGGDAYLSWWVKYSVCFANLNEDIAGLSEMNQTLQRFSQNPAHNAQRLPAEQLIKLSATNDSGIFDDYMKSVILKIMDELDRLKASQEECPVEDILVGVFDEDKLEHEGVDEYFKRLKKNIMRELQQIKSSGISENAFTAIEAISEAKERILIFALAKTVNASDAADLFVLDKYDILQHLTRKVDDIKIEEIGIEDDIIDDRFVRIRELLMDLKSICDHTPENIYLCRQLNQSHQHVFAVKAILAMLVATFKASDRRVYNFFREVHGGAVAKICDDLRALNIDSKKLATNTIFAVVDDLLGSFFYKAFEDLSSTHDDIYENLRVERDTERKQNSRQANAEQGRMGVVFV